MRILPLVLVVALSLAGCVSTRADLNTVPDRQGHAYDMSDPGDRPAQGGEAAEPGPDERVVSVQAGDTLWALAEQHGVSLSWLIRRNDIRNRPVPAGTQLVVPAQ